MQLIHIQIRIYNLGLNRKQLLTQSDEKNSSSLATNHTAN